MRILKCRREPRLVAHECVLDIVDVNCMQGIAMMTMLCCKKFRVDFQETKSLGCKTFEIRKCVLQYKSRWCLIQIDLNAAWWWGANVILLTRSVVPTWRERWRVHYSRSRLRAIEHSWWGCLGNNQARSCQNWKQSSAGRVPLQELGWSKCSPQELGSLGTNGEFTHHVGVWHPSFFFISSCLVS